MIFRRANFEDAELIAHMHVQAWTETYPGLLPDDEIALKTPELRRVQWQDQLERGESRVLVADGIGFAQMGTQRDPARLVRYPEELYAFYTLRAAQGQGAARRLLRAAVGPEPLPFTALVLSTNERALGFYKHVGAQEIGRSMGDDGFEDVILGWSDPLSV